MEQYRDRAGRAIRKLADQLGSSMQFVTAAANAFEKRYAV
jgi:hypothetical protein